MYKLPIAVMGLVAFPFLAGMAMQEAGGPVYLPIDPWDKFAQYGAIGLILFAVGLGIREGWVFFKLKVWPDFQAFLAKFTTSVEALTGSVNALTQQTHIQHQQMMDLLVDQDKRREAK